jgi:hypothetical protein
MSDSPTPHTGPSFDLACPECPLHVITRTTWFGTDMTAGELGYVLLPIALLAIAVLILWARRRPSTTAPQIPAEHHALPASPLPESVRHPASNPRDLTDQNS